MTVNDQVGQCQASAGTVESIPPEPKDLPEPMCQVSPETSHDGLALKAFSRMAGSLGDPEQPHVFGGLYLRGWTSNGHGREASLFKPGELSWRRTMILRHY